MGSNKLKILMKGHTRNMLTKGGRQVVLHYISLLDKNVNQRKAGDQNRGKNGQVSF